MTALNIVTTYIQQKKGLLLPALFANILDSITNALLLISIGKAFSLFVHDSSSKSQLFDTFLFPINDFREWTVVFFVLLAVKAVSTFMDHWLNHKATEGFVQFVRQAQLSTWSSSTDADVWKRHAEQWQNSIHSEQSNLRKLISSGVLEAAADLSYLVILFVLFFSIDASLMWMVLAFLPVYALSAWILGALTSRWKRERTGRREHLKDTEARMLRTAASQAQFNRRSAWEKKWQRATADYNAVDQRWSAAKALSETITPLIFFCMLFTVLKHLNEVGTFQEQSFSFILLLIYAQGSLRRSMRIPAVWINGLHSLRKLLPLSMAPMHDSEKTEVRITTLTLQKESKKIPLALHGIHYLRTPTATERAQLLHETILGIRTPNGTPYLLLNDELHDAPTQRRYIGAVSHTIDFAGDTFESAMLIGSDAKRAERLQKMVIDLHLDVPTHWTNHTVLTEAYLYQWQLVRLVLHDRKVLVIDDPFARLSPTEIERLNALLMQISTHRTVIILSEKEPPIPLPFQLHLL